MQELKRTCGKCEISGYCEEKENKKKTNFGVKHEPECSILGGLPTKEISRDVLGEKNQKLFDDGRKYLSVVTVPVVDEFAPTKVIFVLHPDVRNTRKAEPSPDSAFAKSF